MSKVKIIHCADIHFDSSFHELTDNKAEQRKEDLRETFGRIVDLAQQEQVDLILISGDLFDNTSVMKTTLEFIIKKLEEIPEIKVFIAPGNHDPYFNKSHYKMLKWPENVYIFSNTIEKIHIPDLNTCIYGIGFGSQHQSQSLIEGFSVQDSHPDSDLINIMVLHGDVVNSGAGSEYNPISLEQIGKSKLDYLALGHKHAFSGINKEGVVYWAYCGAPEGRGFDELGPKGVIIGEVGKEYADLKFKEINKRAYYEKNIDISGCTTYDQVSRIIVKETGDGNKNKKNNLYKIVLEGEIDQGFNINTGIIEDKVKDQFYFLKIIDRTKLKIDLDLLQREYSLLGIFAGRMGGLIDQANDEDGKRLYEEALRMGISALKDEEVK